MGERITASRIKKGLSQKVVAEHLGMAPSTYGHYERDRSEPDIETLAKMAMLFDTSLDYLLTGKDDQGEGSAPPNVTDPPVCVQDPPSLAGLLDRALRTLEVQAQNQRLREENERLRIEKVDAVAQENLKRILDQLDQLGSEAHTEGRDDEGAAGGSESLVG